MMATGQLALGLGHAPALGRADFVVGTSNRAALATIEAWPRWPSDVLLLNGPEGAGKTHLLHIWSEQSGGRHLSGSRLNEALPTIEAISALAIDDVDGLDPDGQVALFHALNGARERGASVLLAAREPLAVIERSFPDLASRLRAASPVALSAPDDELLGRVLVKLFGDRQLAVPAPVLSYLVTRMERSYAAAATLVDRIDDAALRSGRPLTRALAAAALQEPDAGAEAEKS